MINPKAKLDSNIFTDKLTRKPTRDGYGDGVILAAETDPNVVVLCADLTESTRSLAFAKKFPERFLELGVAEQNMATVAAGMALAGKIPFIASYAMFSPGRNWEQIRTTICYNDVPVKIVGAHAGVSVGPDGATHQALEDIALMRVLPNIDVIVPCDAVETRKATVALARTGKPGYLRLTREKTALFTTDGTPFGIGKAEIFFQAENPIIAIIACGPLVYQSLEAAKRLAEENLPTIVINNPSIKPLDEKTILETAAKVEAVITVEEHQAAAGLGGAVAELLAKKLPKKMAFIGVQDRFGESGTPDELLGAFRLSSEDIVKAAKNILNK
ncbi:MAG: transketolase C-terminal domain-containing protein [Candidatus Paceibacterota bacterium]